MRQRFFRRTKDDYGPETYMLSSGDFFSFSASKHRCIDISIAG